MQEKKFYVYVHKYASGPKKGQVFYVGKGKDRRSIDKSSRSAYWKHIVNKYDYTHSIIMRFDSEACAFSFERALIKHYGRENLCNLTDGGDGASGYIPNSETRAKISAALIGNKNSLGFKHSEDTRSLMSDNMKGRLVSDETRLKLSKNKSGDKHHSFDPTEYVFIHTSGAFFIGTRFQFRTKYHDLYYSAVNDMVRGRYKEYKGWSVIGTICPRLSLKSVCHYQTSALT